MVTGNSEQELKLSKQSGFFDSSRTIRICIGLLFSLGLFLFLHFREIRVEFLELNSTAPRYVVAEIDFSFPDEEATAVLKQEALLDVGKIFALDVDGVKKRRLEFENFLIYDQEWRDKARLSTFDEMYKAVQKLERVLIELRFSDARTIEKMQKINFPCHNYIEVAPFDMRQGAYFPEKVWDQIEARTFGGQHFHDGTGLFIINYFKKKIWVLQEDIQAERKLRKKIHDYVPLQYTEVVAGSRIIDQGEKVTSRTLAMIQAMKQALNEKRNLFSLGTVCGSFIITCLITLACGAFFKSQFPDILSSNRQLLLLVVIALFGMGLAKITEFLLLRNGSSFFELVRYPLLTPFVAILTCSLVNPGVAIFAVATMTALLDAILAFERHGFMITNLVVALFAILYTRNLRRRTEIFIVCAKSWMISALLICGLYFYDAAKSGSTVALDIASSGAFMLITAVLVVGLLPLFESVFRILSDITLMEYMDPNHELLRRLTIEAPGTYQHSLIMGNIAEGAARAIGANGLFCRVATLYHDIGKMTIAQYFTENQQLGVNIHQLLTPVESAQVIMSHVPEGVALARKAGLPEQFIDIIKEHHGTSLVYYFYHKQLESVQGNRDLVDEKEFRYQGPKPRTKESVIIMISDCIEAASRSLDEVNEETVTKLVDLIVKEKLEDGQFDDSLLTFEELSRVKKAVVKNLLAVGHLRIKYPARVKRAS